MNVNWIKLPDSEVGEVLIVGSDITGKKRAEDELRSKTALLEAQMQATIDGILAPQPASFVPRSHTRA